MSFTFGNMALNSGTVGPLRFAGGQTRGRIQGGMNGMSYPSPFFDIAHTYLPTTIKQLFKYCRYYFLTQPTINAVATKMSEYPVTDLVLDHEDPEVVNKWEEYLHNTVRVRSFQVESGLDYNVYGTSAVSMSFPFQKYLTCRNCGFSEQAKKIRPNWIYTNNEFRLNCPRCQNAAAATPKDLYFRDASSIRPIRWNVEDIELSYNDVTGESTYFFTIPAPLRADITLGKKDVVEGMPQIFLQAIRQQKGVVFSKSNFFVMKRATLAWQDRGWGIPMILPVLKDAFYLQIMKKAQEQLLLEHIIPLRVIFPQAASGTSDPFSNVSLVDWRDQLATEIARWRLDPNYIPLLPIPIGNQTIGGDGKALLLTGEIMNASDQIIMGMGSPLEFIKGGASWSGSNVSMRMLENAFISYIAGHRHMINWIIDMVAHFMDWPKVKARFKPFKMADDLQRKAYLFQLNQAQKISDTTLLSDSDFNMEEENKIMIQESSRRVEAIKKSQLAMAAIQGESQVIMMKMQARAQQAMQQAMAQPPAPGEPGVSDEGWSGSTVAGQGGALPAAQGAPPQLGPAPIGEQPSGSAPQEAQSQLNAGQDLGAAPGQEQMPVDLVQLAEGYASQIVMMQPQEQQMALNALAAQSQELAQLVTEFIGLMQNGQSNAVPAPGGSTATAASGGVDQRALPQVLPPRRQAALV